MPHRENRTNKSTLDSLHKIWKFKTVELIEDPSGAMRTVNIENYELWDLTKKDTLTYSLKDSIGVSHSVRYKIVDNAMVLQFPNNENNMVVQFKIADLTSDRLKVILHVTYTIKDPTYTLKNKNRDDDLIELIFEAKYK